MHWIGTNQKHFDSFYDAVAFCLFCCRAQHRTSCSPGPTNLSWWKTVGALWIRVKGHLLNCSPASLEERSWLSSSLSTLEHESLDLECLWRTHTCIQTGYMSKGPEWKVSACCLSGKNAVPVCLPVVQIYTCWTYTMHENAYTQTCSGPSRERELIMLFPYDSQRLFW